MPPPILLYQTSPPKIVFIWLVSQPPNAVGPVFLNPPPHVTTSLTCGQGMSGVQNIAKRDHKILPLFRWPLLTHSFCLSEAGCPAQFICSCFYLDQTVLPYNGCGYSKGMSLRKFHVCCSKMITFMIGCIKIVSFASIPTLHYFAYSDYNQTSLV